jgi:hypothetical protein
MLLEISHFSQFIYLWKPAEFFQKRCHIVLASTFATGGGGVLRGNAYEVPHDFDKPLAIL